MAPGTFSVVDQTVPLIPVAQQLFRPSGQRYHRVVSSPPMRISSVSIRDFLIIHPLAVDLEFWDREQVSGGLALTAAAIVSMVNGVAAKVSMTACRVASSPPVQGHTRSSDHFNSVARSGSTEACRR